MNNIDKNLKLDGLSIGILIISIIMIFFSFIAPIIFVNESLLGIDFSDKGQIGDTIGGLMNPFIAISGVLLTFLAFYIQFKANRLQRDLFRQELDSNKFENQFYEMLRLHKENVNEFEIHALRFFKNEHQHEFRDEIIKGRRVFDFMIKEFEICYYAAKECFPDISVKACVNEAYGVIFHGINSINRREHKYFRVLFGIKTNHEYENYSNIKSIVKQILKIEWEHDLTYNLFNGYSSQLAHYYRHLYQTVKFVVYQNDSIINYEEKRKYLRILRAQLSNNEQAMLFYNWLSRFGEQWENENNKFFTDYRMIHNIYSSLLIPEIVLGEFFDLKGNYLKERNRNFDPLFEFEDW
jgi:hypothetical protein